MKRQQVLLLGLFRAVIFVLFFSACSTKEKEMPITTSSEEAKQLFIQARDYYENIEFQKSLKLLDDAIAIDTNFALAYLYKGLVSGSLSKLSMNIERASLLAENVTDGEKLLIDMTKSSNLDNDQKKSNEYLDKLIVMFPKDPRVYLYKGWHMANTGEYDSAVVYLKTALELNPNYTPAHNLLGYAYLRTKKYDMAEKEFLENIRIAPDRPNPYDSYGEFLFGLGRYEGSQQNYRKAIELDNSWVGSSYNIGDSYLFMNNYSQAREEYNKFIQRAGSFNEKYAGYLSVALSYLYENKPEESLKQIKDLERLSKGENENYYFLNTLGYEAAILCEFGKPNEGLIKYLEMGKLIASEKLSQRDRDRLLLYMNNNLAYAYAINDDLLKANEKAELFKQDILKSNRNDIREAPEWLKVFLENKSGNYAKSIEMTRNLKNPDLEDKYYLAKAYLQTGDKIKAKELFNEIKESKENFFQSALLWTKVNNELAKL
ncbi:MAG: tetratricopeptide repeat protein [Ignavibacteriales bacterium]|nr:tetratricopeptide repeat protein [Ignavibacteriales bacterium]